MLSNTSAPFFSSHNEETTERQNTSLHLNDDKQSVDALLSESKRLIKSVTLSPIFHMHFLTIQGILQESLQRRGKLQERPQYNPSNPIYETLSKNGYLYNSNL